METSASRCLSRVSSHVSLSPMMSKCSVFVSAISSSIFGGSDWALAESTLSVFGCWCGGGGGGGCGGDGGVCGGGDGGGGHDGGGGGGFHGLFKGFPLEVGCLPRFPTGGLGPFGPERHLCCYTNTGAKYPAPSPLRCRPSLNRWVFSLNAK